MEARDLIVTPILLILVYIGAYVARPWFTDPVIRKYYFPAITLKIFGALALGFLYQFHYGGGDTFNFHTIGSRYIWEAFIDSPSKGIDLLFSNGEFSGSTYEYASKIYFYRDPSSFFVIRVATIFDLLTFSTYSSTAILFSIVSFLGSWAFFIAMYRQTPHLHKLIAMAILFIPSVVFWGSGLMKDTLTFACLGFMTYACSNLFIRHRKRIISLLLLVVSAWVIFSVKKYILLCFIPAAFLWLYVKQINMIKSAVFKLMMLPFVAGLIIVVGYFSVDLISRDDPRYALDKIAETSRITAYDIGFFTGRDAGSNYSLGDLDGTVSGMVKLTPQAINVSLFRPYLWEVRNPLMLLSALESAALLLLTAYVIIKKRTSLFETINNPNVAFCLFFSLSFAFAVGISTFNFGALSRYKIPLLPFYSLSLIYIYYNRNNDKKTEVFEPTE